MISIRIRFLLCISIITLLSLGCSTPQATAYLIPPQQPTNWEEVFANPQPVRLTTLQTGTFQVPDKQHFLDGEDDVVASYEQDSDALPVYAHLAEHDDKGLFLFDAGFGVSPAEHTGWLMNTLLSLNGRWFDVPESQDLVAKLGTRAENIEAVFLTHLHFDHISGVRDLPLETRVVVGPYTPTLPTRVAMGRYLNGRTLKELDFSNAQVMEPFGPCIDLLGDQSLWAIQTNGHTLGHVSYLINGLTPTLLTGDVVHFRWAFDNNVPSISMGGDRNSQRRSLDQITAFATKFPDVQIVFGHELPSEGK